MEGCTNFIVVLIFLGMINIGSAQSSTTLVTAVLTFGDSTMDVGNNNYLPSDFKANFQIGRASGRERVSFIV